ncbi:unnamed protein product, partial [Amoebophrya sp. A25]|eukprot:GSA25T00020634001.1
MSRHKWRTPHGSRFRDSLLHASCSMLFLIAASSQTLLTPANAAPVAFGFGSCAKQEHENKPWRTIDQTLSTTSGGSESDSNHISTDDSNHSKLPFFWLGDAAYQKKSNDITADHLTDQQSG